VDSANCVWNWDLDNDGAIDSDQRDPRWSYSQSGAYDVGLKINTGRDSAEYMLQNAVYRATNGAGLEFVGDMQPLTVAMDSSLDLPHNLTVEFWMKIDSSFLQTFDNVELFSKRGALNLYLTVEFGFEVAVNLEGDEETLFQTEDSLLAPGQWHHAAMVFDAGDSRIYLYLDGSPVLVKQNENPYLGLRWISEYGGVDIMLGNEYMGIIDELRVWNYSRNGEEIIAGMQQRLTGAETGLVGYWPMDEGCGYLVSDMTGHGLWGVVSNPTWVEGFPLQISGLDDLGVIANHSPLELSPGCPNPFNPHTVLEYRLPQSANTRIQVFNIMGQKVRELVNGTETAGVHRVVWDGSDDAGISLASGVYLIRMRVGTEERVRKVMLMK